MEMEETGLRALLDIVGEGLIVFDQDYRMLAANQAALRLWGYREDELYGRHVAMLMTEGYHSLYLDAARAPRNGIVQCEGLRNDGSTFPLELSLKQSYLDGELITSATARDLTEWALAEQQLRFQKSLLKAQSDASIDGMLVISEQGGILSCNHRFSQLWQVPPTFMLERAQEHIMQHILGQLASPDELLARMTHLYAHPEQTGHGEITLKDGRTFDCYSAPVKGGSGHFYGRVWFFRDISEAVAARTALHAREQHFRALIEESSDMISLLSVNGDIQYVSPSTTRTLGYQSDELVGRNAFELVHPEDREPTITLLKDLLVHPEKNITAYYRIRHRNGTWRWIEGCGRNLLSEPSVQAIVVNYRDISERKALEEQLLHGAYHDALTGLPNRKLLMDRLHRLVERARRRPAPFAVLLVDLDRFKEINDSLGHLIGDRLLVGVARRLERCLRPSDTVARLGGDEFAILLEDINGIQNATLIADRLQRELSEPFILDGHEVFTSASVGITISSTSYTGVEDLLRHADIAMYRAKERGKACYEIFDHQMQVWAVERLQLEGDLRHALERQELRVHYQPIVSLENGAISGFEALVRWQHQQRGLLPPDIFLPIAEETGLIVPIGWWLLRETCRNLRTWQARFQLAEPLTVSINLSSRQLAQPDLVERICQILDEHQLPPSCLKLEITETIIIEQADKALAALTQLHQHGIEIYMDDFGTGYSSLSYIHRLPLDVVKVDRSFITSIVGEIKHQEIVRAILALTQSLGLGLIAEGIETEDQLQQLRGLGCSYGQGFLFARPLDHAAAEAALERQYGG